MAEFQLFFRNIIVLAVSRERCVFHVDRMWPSIRGGGAANVDRGEGLKNLISLWTS